MLGKCTESTKDFRTPIALLSVIHALVSTVSCPPCFMQLMYMVAPRVTINSQERSDLNDALSLYMLLLLHFKAGYNEEF